MNQRGQHILAATAITGITLALIAIATGTGTNNQKEYNQCPTVKTPLPATQPAQSTE